MTNPFLEATIIVSRLIAFAVLLQSVEYWQLRQKLWSWNSLKPEFPSLIPQIFSQKIYESLVAAQLLASIALLFFAEVNSVRGLLLIGISISTLLISVRWRGAFNGGADSMTLIVLFFLGLSSLVENEKLKHLFFAYIAIQTCLSYFISGWIKLRRAEWRNGSALQGILHYSNFGIPTSLVKLTASRARALILSWLLIIFECSFPLALLHPSIATFFISCGLIFHLLNFYAFGLNRFFFAWTAAYATIPATATLLGF